MSEYCFLVGPAGLAPIEGLIRSGRLRRTFEFRAHRDEVFGLMRKYADVPMSFADACLVRMTEVMPDPVVLTTDSDFRIYRRNGRRVVPCLLPR